MVWCTGMGDWAEASTVKELVFLFDSNVTAPINTEIPNIPNNQNIGNSQQYNQNSNYNNSSNQKMYNSNVFGYKQNPNNLDVRPMPKNWLVESILVTVLCCLPFGIAGIVNATKVESLYYSGDYESAEKASKDAKKWTLIGFFSMGGFLILYFGIIIFAALISSF